MLRDPGRVPTGFLRSRHGPYVPSRNRNSQLREPAGRYGTAVTVGGMLAEAGTTCPRGRAPSGCVCALSRPRWERLSQSAIWNGRIALSALRPAGDRCREMQACSTLVHHITSMRGVAPYKCQFNPTTWNTGAKTKTPKFVTQQTAPSLRRRGRGAGREIDTRHPEIGRGPC